MSFSVSGASSVSPTTTSRFWNTECNINNVRVNASTNRDFFLNPTMNISGLNSVNNELKVRHLILEKTHPLPVIKVTGNFNSQGDQPSRLDDASDRE